MNSISYHIISMHKCWNLMYFYRINIQQWLSSYHLRVFSLLSVESKATSFFLVMKKYCSRLDRWDFIQYVVYHNFFALRVVDLCKPLTPFYLPIQCHLSVIFFLAFLFSFCFFVFGYAQNCVLVFAWLCSLKV